MSNKEDLLESIYKELQRNFPNIVEGSFRRQVMGEWIGEETVSDTSIELKSKGFNDIEVEFFEKLKTLMESEDGTK